MSEFTIRPARLSDLPKLLLFEQGIIGAERPFDDAIKPDPVHYYDIGEMISAPHIEIVVAETEGEIMGCGYARIEITKHFLKHPRYAYLGFMYVDPAHRGKGVNSAVIAALKTWVLAQHITEMRLDVYEGNFAAIKAYEKVGFRKHLISMKLDLSNR
jgi:ribosomal protein S18 acetylase RimI-like enzyme